MKTLLSSLIFASCVLLAACSTQQTTQKDETQDQDIYVFDDVGLSDSTQVEEQPVIEPVDTTTFTQEDNAVDAVQFIVQVGAFTSADRAQLFVDENQSKINWQMTISYSPKVLLHVVQLPPFATRSEAEYVRDQLWQTETFKDAFIVPEN